MSIFSKYAGDQKTQSFSDEVIKVEHLYWGETSGTIDQLGYLVNTITLVNNSKEDIENVEVLLDVDDNSINWDATLLDAQLRSVDTLNLNFGKIKSGGSASLKYRLCYKCLNGEPGDKTYDFQINIMPSYTITYHKSDAWSSSGIAKP